jgi:hypothetical protein
MDRDSEMARGEGMGSVNDGNRAEGTARVDPKFALG